MPFPVRTSSSPGFLSFLLFVLLDLLCIILVRIAPGRLRSASALLFLDNWVLFGGGLVGALRRDLFGNDICISVWH